MDGYDFISEYLYSERDMFYGLNELFLLSKFLKVVHYMYAEIGPKMPSSKLLCPSLVVGEVIDIAI